MKPSYRAVVIGGINIATDPARWEALEAGWATFRAMAWKPRR